MSEFVVVFRSSFAIAAIIALPACTSGSDPADTGDPTGASGKADGLRSCEPDRNCLQFRSYDVLFTNPQCQSYPYGEPIAEVDGERKISAKPKNVYCHPIFDADNARLRNDSPQHRLLQWVDALDSGDEIFLAYFRFTDQAIADALCEAERRGAEVTFVLDKLSHRSEQLSQCGGEILLRGGVGSIGFEHNRLIMINPDHDDDFIKMSYGSGDISSGTHLHHENWHFLDVARESFFVQSHQCLMRSLLEEEHTQGKTAYTDFMAKCRSAIDAEPEDDITPFFIPALADRKALFAGKTPSNASADWFRQPDMLTLIDEAATVDIGAYRFSATKMIDPLIDRLQEDGRAFHLRLIADDDLYWLSPRPPSEIRNVGLNTFAEAAKLDELRAADSNRGRFEEAYMETNHEENLRHHNRFMIFGDMDGRADTVLMGSPDLTGTGFDDNLGNLYITDIPEVVAAFQTQYALWWDGEGPLPEGHDVAPRASHDGDMPIELFAPQAPGDDGGCGLRIAEVVYDAVNADNGKEWIKLYNSCEEDVSLNGASLGWGGGSYRTGGQDLAGNIAGKSCLIIGGPTSDGSNGMPDVDLEANFSPDLQNSGTDADGIALFLQPRAEIDGDTVPEDAVVYGGSNTAGLLDASGKAVDPHVRDVAAGSSIVRTGATTWDEAATPVPDECPTF